MKFPLPPYLRLLPLASMLLAGTILIPACDGGDKKPAAGQKAGKKKGKKKKGKKKKKNAELTPQEAAMELDRCLGELRCIEDSALSPEEKAAAAQKLLPTAALIAAAAEKAGGYEAIMTLLREHKQKLADEVAQVLQEKKLHPRQLKPEMLSAEWNEYWNTWTETCERYKLDPNRLMTSGDPKIASEFITACGGTPNQP